MQFLFILLLMINLNSYSQENQFQGEISYSHRFLLKPGVDSGKIMHPFGTFSQFIYKDGSYKRTTTNGVIRDEYYSAQSGNIYNKYEDSDTLFLMPGSNDDTLLDYYISPGADTVCGYVCDELVATIGKKSDMNAFHIRIISYSRELPIDPEALKRMHTSCAYEIYKITRSVPLRISMYTGNWPSVLMFIEAIKADCRPVSSGEIAIPANSILKK